MTVENFLKHTDCKFFPPIFFHVFMQFAMFLERYISRGVFFFSFFVIGFIFFIYDFHFIPNSQSIITFSNTYNPYHMSPPTPYVTFY